MGSIDGPNDVEELHKHNTPFKIISIAIDRITRCAIPLHVKALQVHCDNIAIYQNRKEWRLLHAEQIKASSAVKLLRSDLNELELLNAQVRPEDEDAFLRKIESPTREVIEVLAAFLDSHSHVMKPLPCLDDESPVETDDFPKLICNLDDPSNVEESEELTKHQLQAIPKPSKVLVHWIKLKNDLHELNELFKKFGTIVFSQKESVDTIENHVHDARENVLEGTNHLRKASILQAASFPIAGAVVGALLLGPVGAVAGFKIFGTAACAVSGSVLGFGAGRKIKQKRHVSCDLEMKALTYNKSSSLSDLSNIDNVQNKN